MADSILRVEHNTSSKSKIIVETRLQVRKKADASRRHLQSIRMKLYWINKKAKKVRRQQKAHEAIVRRYNPPTV